MGLSGSLIMEAPLWICRGATQFKFTIKILVYRPGVGEHWERLMRYSLVTVREIITDTPFKAMNWEALAKPVGHRMELPLSVPSKTISPSPIRLGPYSGA